MRFELTILGSGSALPTSNRNTTAQVLNVLERFFLIDCGEGTQMQLRKHKFAFNHIDHICISHLHGDHYFGLFGLLSSMAMLDRKRPLNIYAPLKLKEFLNIMVVPDFENYSFPINFHALSNEPLVIFDDNVLSVTAFPLRHTVPVWGFLFKEKPRPRKIKPEVISQYNISISEIHRIKHGENLLRDYHEIQNDELTTESLPPRSYAFVTDTLITRQHNHLLQNVDVLYHEATFLHNDLSLARQTMHATARQAAELANEINVGQLLLGHFSSRYKSDDEFLNEALSYFKNVIVATDGLKISWPITH